MQTAPCSVQPLRVCDCLHMFTRFRYTAATRCPCLSFSYFHSQHLQLFSAPRAGLRRCQLRLIYHEPLDHGGRAHLISSLPRMESVYMCIPIESLMHATMPTVRPEKRTGQNVGAASAHWINPHHDSDGRRDHAAKTPFALAPSVVAWPERRSR
jgi:hypothetical protein